MRTKDPALVLVLVLVPSLKFLVLCIARTCFGGNLNLALASTPPHPEAA